MKKSKYKMQTNHKSPLKLLRIAVSWMRFKKIKVNSTSHDMTGKPDSIIQTRYPLVSLTDSCTTERTGFVAQNEMKSQYSSDYNLYQCNDKSHSITGNQPMELKADVLLSLSQVARTITEIIEQMGMKDGPVYMLSSWFLHDCYRYLVQREVESMHYVTGMQFGNVFTLDRMVTFCMSHQSVISACGDSSSTHRVLIEMDSYGHGLHAYFHSHPGNGESSVYPSYVDLDYQARLEKGGYAAIGGIFSRDGYFRAYSLANPFRIVVYGKGVEKINERTYRLTTVN